jgi:hypothetical protein
MATGTRPLLSEGTLQAIQAYAEQTRSDLTTGDIAQIENCVSLWTKAEDCGAEFCRVCLIIWEAIKSIFCQSTWQQTRRMLVERANAPAGTPAEEGAKLAAEFALTCFVEANKHKLGRDNGTGMRDFRRAVEEQRMIPVQRHVQDQLQAGAERLRSAMESGQPAAAGAAMGQLMSGIMTTLGAGSGIPGGAAGVPAPSSLRPPHASAATAQRGAGAPPSRFAVSTASGVAARPAASGSEAALRQELARIADERLALLPDSAMPASMKAQMRQMGLQAIRVIPSNILAQQVEVARRDLERLRQLTPDQRAAEVAPGMGAVSAIAGAVGQTPADLMQMGTGLMSMLADAGQAGGADPFAMMGQSGAGSVGGARRAASSRTGGATVSLLS